MDVDVDVDAISFYSHPTISSFSASALAKQTVSRPFRRTRRFSLFYSRSHETREDGEEGDGYPCLNAYAFIISSSNSVIAVSVPVVRIKCICYYSYSRYIGL